MRLIILRRSIYRETKKGEKMENVYGLQLSEKKENGFDFVLEYIPDEKIPENTEFELESDLIPLKMFG